MTIEELVCALIFMFFAVQGSIPFVAPSQALEVTHASASELTFYGGILVQVAVNAGISLLLLLNLQRLHRGFRAMQWTAPLALVVLASACWSQYPAISMRRSVPFALATLFGLYFAMRFPLQRQLRILWESMVVLALVSFLLAIAVPSVGLDASVGHHGNWQGVFTQKNSCGRMMVLALVLMMAGRHRMLEKVSSAALFLFVLVMSGSRSAWLAAAIVLVLSVWLWLAARFEQRSRMLFFGASGMLILGFVALAAVGYREILPMLGRDATLSGRTEIWRQVLIAIREHPWLGWGYAAYWHGTEGAAFHTVAALHFVVLHAHNGFLEIWLEIGAVGLTCWVASYLRAWRKLFPALRAGDASQASWMFILLLLTLLFNLDENAVLTFNGIFWVLYVSVVANLEQGPLPRRAFARTLPPPMPGTMELVRQP